MATPMRSFRCDDQLWTAANAAAAIEGRELAEVLRSALQRYVKAAAKRTIASVANGTPPRPLRPLSADVLADPVALSVAHSVRFRRVSNGYPRRVAEAYGRDIAAAAADDDATVAQRVAEYERAHGLPVRDWPSQGRSEGRSAVQS